MMLVKLSSIIPPTSLPMLCGGSEEHLRYQTSTPTRYGKEHFLPTATRLHNTTLQRSTNYIMESLLVQYLSQISGPETISKLFKSIVKI